jgi:hypothetical protein
VTHSTIRTIPTAFLVCSLIWLPGCAPNREEWMSQAATQQAQAATGSIRDEQEVKKESRVAAQVLRTLSEDASNAGAGPNQQAAIAFAQDAVLISSGLDAIADSQTDEQFTHAVWSICYSECRLAAPRVGNVLLGVASTARARVAADPSNAQVLEHTATYMDVFGERLIGIPSQCDQASAGMAEADAEEQKAEADHQANVNTAMSAAALVFAGAVILGTSAASVAAAEASRPVIIQEPAPAFAPAGNRLDPAYVPPPPAQMMGFSQSLRSAPPVSVPGM